jgi:TyrR family helix-turn-helix protein
VLKKRKGLLINGFGLSERLISETPVKGLKETHFNDLQVHSLKEMVGSYEKGILKSVLEKYPSVRQGAKALNLSHTAVINKIKKYGIAFE